MEHGGDLLTYESYYNGELVDFSSNINPLGTPDGLEQQLINSFNTLESYPDIKYRKLKDSIANYLKCSTKNVLVGNGAVEIINNFIIPSKRVVVMTPAFSEYEKRAQAHGKETIKVSYNGDFSIDIENIDKVLKSDDLLIIGNPNNPTGLRIEKSKLLEINNLVLERNAFLLLDEAFYEFCPSDYDTIDMFKDSDYKNIGIIRAATKFFALPGIRLGYGCTSKSKVNEISKIELPWSVNSLADIAGQFIFRDQSYIEESKKYIQLEREFLLNELSKISGIMPYNTHTNYILIKILCWNEEYLFKFFLKEVLLLGSAPVLMNLGRII